MSAEMLAVIVGAVGLVVTIFQGYFSHRAAKRQRDVEMVHWAGEVIDLMAELEAVCFPLATNSSDACVAAEALSVRASALLDRGRLFFRNVLPKKLAGNGSDEGIRVKILDRVLKAHYVARFLASGGTADRLMLRRQIWQARGEFVRLLQAEMGQALKRQGQDSGGEHVPADPTRWPEPERSLHLPVKTA
jgi:hypothetical protein